MPAQKLSRLELRILEALWTRGACSIREVLEALTADRRPAYTTVQTIVYRLERKGAVQRIRRVGNADIFEASLTRADAVARMAGELLGGFPGCGPLVLRHLIAGGELSLDDLKAAKQILKERGGKKGPK